MINRRSFLFSAATPLLARKKKMTPRERVDAALRGEAADRPPFTLWHHFGLEAQGPEAHARATLDFHARYGSDLVKVMSDFAYPKEQGVLATPFPAQLRALELIRDGLSGSKHFVETVFNPWNVAEKLTSKDEVARMQREAPGKLKEWLGTIAQSEANHARSARERGVSGVFLAIANAQDGILSLDEYREFSEPFDRMVIEAVSDLPLNIIHLHGPKVYVEHFLRTWKGVTVHYSEAETRFSLADAHAIYPGTLMGGIDHRSYRNLSVEQLRTAARRARDMASPNLIVAPGCSVPDDCTPKELLLLRKAMEKL
jgi:uroporphyrinogen decarboxylase